MEGSEGEAVFNSLNLNPQLFINEALNTVDDLVDDAFDFYLQQASTLLETKGTDRSQDLSQVNQIGTVTESIQAALDSKPAGWGVMLLRIEEELGNVRYAGEAFRSP